MLLEEMYYNIDLERVPKFTKIVGISFYDRQSHIDELSIGDKLFLKRDYKNIHDKNAIGVYKNNYHLGWISKNISKILAPEIDNGLYWEAKVSNITGNKECTLGVNIELIFIDK